MSDSDEKVKKPVTRQPVASPRRRGPIRILRAFVSYVLFAVEEVIVVRVVRVVKKPATANRVASPWSTQGQRPVVGSIVHFFGPLILQHGNARDRSGTCQPLC